MGREIVNKPRLIAPLKLIRCLVSQAKEFESTLPEEELEKSVLREFGRCLEQIIESANSCVLGASHA